MSGPRHPALFRPHHRTRTCLGSARHPGAGHRRSDGSGAGPRWRLPLLCLSHDRGGPVASAASTAASRAGLARAARATPFEITGEVAAHGHSGNRPAGHSARAFARRRPAARPRAAHQATRQRPGTQIAPGDDITPALPGAAARPRPTSRAAGTPSVTPISRASAALVLPSGPPPCCGRPDRSAVLAVLACPHSPGEFMSRPAGAGRCAIAATLLTGAGTAIPADDRAAFRRLRPRPSAGRRRAAYRHRLWGWCISRSGWALAAWEYAALELADPQDRGAVAALLAGFALSGTHRRPHPHPAQFRHGEPGDPGRAVRAGAPSRCARLALAATVP